MDCMVRGGSSPLGRTGKVLETNCFRGQLALTSRKTPSPCGKTLARVGKPARPPEQGEPTWLDASIPACTPVSRGRGRTLYRALYNDSNGRQRQKRGFSSPSAAAKFRARMLVRAESGELPITRETFAEHFDAWLKGRHRASKGTRDG